MHTFSDLSEKDLQEICYKFDLNRMCNQVVKPEFCNPDSTIDVIEKLSTYVKSAQTMASYVDNLMSFELKSKDEEIAESQEDKVIRFEITFSFNKACSVLVF